MPTTATTATDSVPPTNSPGTSDKKKDKEKRAGCPIYKDNYVNQLLDIVKKKELIKNNKCSFVVAFFNKYVTFQRRLIRYAKLAKEISSNSLILTNQLVILRALLLCATPRTLRATLWLY